MKKAQPQKTIPARKRIALIAHDHRKEDLLKWVKSHREVLMKHDLMGTGTTAALINTYTGLQVKEYLSGALGGDQQIGAAIAEGSIDMMVFFWDPLSAQPHDPDVKALLRVAVLYDLLTASTESTADFIISSPLFNDNYNRK